MIPAIVVRIAYYIADVIAKGAESQYHGAIRHHQTILPNGKGTWVCHCTAELPLDKACRHCILNCPAR